MSKGILIFGGTSEGRELAEKMNAQARAAHFFTATPYGAKLLENLEHITAHAQRLNAEAMYQFIIEHNIGTVVDATHPYASEVTINIQKASAQAGVEYIRVLRKERCYAGITTVASVAQAVDFLQNTEGPVLLTTGSKELKPYCELPDWKERLYVRVLPMPEVITHCNALGLHGEHIIAMQGPFSYELNVALIKHCKCTWLVTKNTGTAGGMDEKIAAALDTCTNVLLIDRPVHESGISVQDALRLLGLNT